MKWLFYSPGCLIRNLSVLDTHFALLLFGGRLRMNILWISTGYGKSVNHWKNDRHNKAYTDLNFNIHIVSLSIWIVNEGWNKTLTITLNVRTCKRTNQFIAWKQEMENSFIVLDLYNFTIILLIGVWWRRYETISRANNMICRWPVARLSSVLGWRIVWS